MLSFDEILSHSKKLALAWLPQKPVLGTQGRHTDRPKFGALHRRAMMTEECVVTDILALARYAGRNLVLHSCCA